ncbi:MAG: S9 family peptidase, partial [Bdellovibrionota bacterium]
TDKLLLGKATGALTAEFWSFDIATKTMKPMIGQGEKEEFDATFGMNPNELFVLTSKFGEFKRLYRYKDGKFDPITPDVKMDVETFSV